VKRAPAIAAALLVAGLALAGSNAIGTGGFAPPGGGGSVNGTEINPSAIKFNGAIFANNTAPTATGFCTSPGVATGVGSGAFHVNVGTACAGSTGTLTFGATAANGWICNCQNYSSGATRTITQTGTTGTTCVLQSRDWTGAAANWVNSDFILCLAFAY
jgi:hypothetical protein